MINLEKLLKTLKKMEKIFFLIIFILAVIDKLSTKKLVLTTEEAQVLQAAIRYDKRIFSKESAIEFFKSRTQSQKIGDANNLA